MWDASTFWQRYPTKNIRYDQHHGNIFDVICFPYRELPLRSRESHCFELQNKQSVPKCIITNKQNKLLLSLLY